MATPDLDWLAQHPDTDSGFLFHVGADWGQSASKSIGVAVSGGGDSMALLHLACTLRDHMGWTLRAVTVDHGLRPEAKEEAAFVSRICADWGIPHDTLVWTGHPDSGNIQALAREARYHLIANWAKRTRTARVLLGHTRDDIAENFLIRLARKAGVDGLAGMDPMFRRHDMEWTRPLWQVSRADLRAYLDRHNVTWIEDPSNDDPRFTRVQMRQALAVLEPLGITAQALSTVSTNLSSAKSALEFYAMDAARDVDVTAAGDVILPDPRKSPRPTDTNRRLLVAALRFVSGKGYAPRQSALDELEAALFDQSSVTLHGCVVSRHSGPQTQPRLVVSREGNTVKDTRCRVDQIWDGRWKLTGPTLKNTEIRALGEAIKDCRDWRDTGLPRTSLMSGPSIWQDNQLISAPLAGFNPQWQAQIVTQYNSYLVSH
ncbi:tRNA lysidine(34) synthetase TilS [Algirhabdus cladophorae]|uniref:tRNA lysidine(34) synthetase TilS n=1 Tax=Algirhabdus cladophorae TaxID=3377108 RepID=UPI003B84906D